MGEVATSACPHGPDGGVATRECGTGGVWEEVDVVQCNTAPPTVQVLLDIAQVRGGARGWFTNTHDVKVLIHRAVLSFATLACNNVA